MFKAHFRHIFAFRLRTVLFLLCAASVSGETYRRNLTKKFDSYENAYVFHYERWAWAPLGKASADILQVFFMLPKTGPIKSALQSQYSDMRHFTDIVLSKVFLQEFVMTIVFVLGAVIVCLLILSPGFVYLFRIRQVAALEDSHLPPQDTSVLRKWVMFETLMVLLAVAIFGGILMCVSVSKVNDELPGVFDFASSNIEACFEIKDILLSNYYHSLSDLSLSAFETIKLLFNINEDVGSAFMKASKEKVDHVVYLAKSIQWDVASIHANVKKTREDFGPISGKTIGKVNSTHKEYTDSLGLLRTVFDGESAGKIFPNISILFVELPKNLSPDVLLAGFDSTISKLQQAVDLNLDTKLQNFSQALPKAVKGPNFDPTNIREQLRNLTFTIELDVRSAVANFSSLLETALTKENRIESHKYIQTVRSYALEQYFVFHVSFLVFAILGTLLGIFLAGMYTLGIIGSKGFRIKSSGPPKRNLPYISGQILLVSANLSLIFLAFFWIISLIMFVLSAVPQELCASTRDKSLVDATVDRVAAHSKGRWYTLFSIPKFNVSMKDTLVKCEQDPAYFIPLPDPILRNDLFDALRKSLGGKALAESLPDVFGGLPDLNLSGADAAKLDLSGALRPVYDADFLGTFDAMLRALKDTGAAHLLPQIRDSQDSSTKLSSAASTAFESFKSYRQAVEKAAEGQRVADISVRGTNISLSVLQVEIDTFLIALGLLDEFARTGARDLYVTILERTALGFVDGVQFNMNLSARELRRTLSYCPVLNAVYRKNTLLMCEAVLFPVAMGWFGSLLVDIFLLLAIVVIVLNLTTFLPLSYPVSEDPDEIVVSCQPDDDGAGGVDGSPALVASQTVKAIEYDGRESDKAAEEPDSEKKPSDAGPEEEEEVKDSDGHLVVAPFVQDSAEAKGGTDDTVEKRKETVGAVEPNEETDDAAEKKEETDDAAEQKEETDGSVEQPKETVGAVVQPKETDDAAERPQETDDADEQREDTVGAVEQPKETDAAAKETKETDDAKEPRKEMDDAEEQRKETVGAVEQPKETEDTANETDDAEERPKETVGIVEQRKDTNDAVEQPEETKLEKGKDEEPKKDETKDSEGEKADDADSSPKQSEEKEDREEEMSEIDSPDDFPSISKSTSIKDLLR